jgi:hypothetical protein
MREESMIVSMRRVATAATIGTVIEWYDFFVYLSAAALVFNKLFFPQADALTGTLLAFGTYAPASWPSRSAPSCRATTAASIPAAWSRSAR